MSIVTRLHFVSFALALFAGNAGAADADFILTNGKVHTLRDDDAVVSALAIGGGKILAAGTDEEALAFKGKATKIIDLKGKLVLPGFIESHAHIEGLGLSAQQLPIQDAKTEAAVAELVRAKVKELKPGEWITGFGWDQKAWGRKDFPQHDLISGAAPDNPVLLDRIDGHMAWANRKAMEIAGVTRETKDPEGGKILRDKAGNPTGIFVDKAIGLVGKFVPDPTPAQTEQAVKAAIAKALKLGITTIHDAGVSAQSLETMRALEKKGELKVRVYAMLRASAPDTEAAVKRGPILGEMLTVRAVKVFVDGAMGSRGAALLEPYSDDSGNLGLLTTSAAELRKIADLALDHGFQVAAHGIGDRANRTILDTYEAAFHARTGKIDPRFRMEHAQLLDEQDLPRIARLGVVVSMQPTHCTSDMAWVTERIGVMRAKEGAYAWKSILSSGATLAFGSDAPVESINPLWGIYAAVTRQDHKGNPKSGWQPQEKLTVLEAVRAYTRGGAYAGFAEAKVGTLEAGKAADVVVLSRDIFQALKQDLLNTNAEMTFVDGKLAYSR